MKKALLLTLLIAVVALPLSAEDRDRHQSYISYDEGGTVVRSGEDGKDVEAHRNLPVYPGDEIVTARRISHPNVMRVFEFGEQDEAVLCRRKACFFREARTPNWARGKPDRAGGKTADHARGDTRDTDRAEKRTAADVHRARLGAVLVPQVDVDTLGRVFGVPQQGVEQ